MPRQEIQFVSEDAVQAPAVAIAPPSAVHLLNRDSFQPAQVQEGTDGVLNPCIHVASFESEGPVSAVSFNSSREVLLQMREPATLKLNSNFLSALPPDVGFADVPDSSAMFDEGEVFDESAVFDETPAPAVGPAPNVDPAVPIIDLGGASVFDTGHEIFHRDSGGGLACASCHPEGGDDGQVWTFEGIGPRRTQSLAMPLRETAPFHWDGSLPTLGALMDDVFVERMGGVFQSEERLDALSHWLFARNAPRITPVDEAAVARGERLFRSKETACSSCHAGTTFTDNRSYDVGTTTTGELLQVPPLAGLLLRPPYMHDGCAKTLHERFTCGGGDKHGKTSHLSKEQIDDLVAYLGSL
jgi:mono/diheme cytochrome c family protein